MRGETEGAFKMLDCLKQISGLSTFLGQCFVRGMIKGGSDLQSVLTVIKDFSDVAHSDYVQVGNTGCVCSAVYK